jgi:hypothetical protein
VTLARTIVTVHSGEVPSTWPLEKKRAPKQIAVRAAIATVACLERGRSTS